MSPFTRLLHHAVTTITKAGCVVAIPSCGCSGIGGSAINGCDTASDSGFVNDEPLRRNRWMGQLHHPEGSRHVRHVFGTGALTHVDVDTYSVSTTTSGSCDDDSASETEALDFKITRRSVTVSGQSVQDSVPVPSQQGLGIQIQIQITCSVCEPFG